MSLRAALFENPVFRRLNATTLIASGLLLAACTHKETPVIRPILSCYGQALDVPPGAPAKPLSLEVDPKTHGYKGNFEIPERTIAMLKAASVLVYQNLGPGKSPIQSGVLVSTDNGNVIVGSAHGLKENDANNITIVGPEGDTAGVKSICVLAQKNHKLISPAETVDLEAPFGDSDLFVAVANKSLKNAFALPLSKQTVLPTGTWLTAAGTPVVPGSTFPSRPQPNIFNVVSLGRGSNSGGLEPFLSNLGGYNGTTPNTNIQEGTSGGPLTIMENGLPAVACIMKATFRGESAAVLEQEYGRNADGNPKVELGQCTAAWAILAATNSTILRF